jgi:hypothetical protein
VGGAQAVPLSDDAEPHEEARGTGSARVALISNR